MKTKILLTLCTCFLFALATPAYAQTSTEDNKDDVTIKVKVQTSDGGYILGGMIGKDKEDDWNAVPTPNGINCLVRKFDACGAQEWEKNFGGSGFDEIESISQVSDGGYIVWAFTNSRNGDVTENHSALGAGSIWLVKLDSKGNIQWQKCLGERKSNTTGEFFKLTSDGGYLVLGETSLLRKIFTPKGYHLFVAKIDAKGNILWQKRLLVDKENMVTLNSLDETSNGEYVIKGSVSRSPENEEVIMKKYYHQTDGLKRQINWTITLNSDGSIKR